MDTTSWQAMAWWIHDNLPYSGLQFFPKLLASISVGTPRRRAADECDEFALL
jgi:hypothetical protein